MFRIYHTSKLFSRTYNKFWNCVVNSSSIGIVHVHAIYAVIWYFWAIKSDPFIFARYVSLHLWGEIHLHVDVYFSSAHVCFRIKNLCGGYKSDFIKKLNWEFSLSPQINFFFLVWATPGNWLEYCSYLRHNIVFVLYIVRFICTWHKIQFFGKQKSPT